MDGTTMNIFVCDDCLANNKDATFIKKV
jgi:hypothetical protein